MLPRSLELRGIIKCTDDHIFEKTLKIELSPIPQAYTLNLKSFDLVPTDAIKFLQSLKFSFVVSPCLVEVAFKNFFFFLDVADLEAKENELDHLITTCTKQLKMLTDDTHNSKYPFCFW